VPFEPRQSGNPAGRPIGSRNKLSESFIAELFADFEQHGAAAIVAMRAANPTAYIRVIAGYCPKR
jgi:hypothetical protein